MESCYSSRPCKQAKQKAGHLTVAGLDSQTERSLLGGGFTHLEAGKTNDRNFFAESCLLEQAYFRDPDQKIQDLIAAAKTKVGEEVSIVRFTRFQVGETAAE